jgi:hypothetical protein
LSKRTEKSIKTMSASQMGRKTFPATLSIETSSSGSSPRSG